MRRNTLSDKLRKLHMRGPEKKNLKRVSECLLITAENNAKRTKFENTQLKSKFK